MRLAPTLRSSHLPTLDGLRALAAFVVVAFHAEISPLHGDFGVALFFVLSGFLITWLLLAEHERTGRISLRAFWLRRVLRIVPPYVALLIVTQAAHAAIGRHWSAGQVASAWTYTVNFYLASAKSLSHPLNHAWSLSIEEQFYLLWPLGFAVLARRGRRALALGISGTVLVSLAWRISATLAGWHSWYDTAYSFATRADALATGCLLAVVLRSPRGVEAAERYAGHPVLPAVVVAALVVLRLYAGSAWLGSGGYTIEALGFALVLVQLMVWHESPLWRWLDHPVMRRLGAWSYSLYLWHLLGLAVAERVGGGVALDVALGVALSLLLAAASHRLIERPFLALKRRVSYRVPPTPPRRPELAARSR